MHTPLDPHLHTDECNKIIVELGQCYIDHNKFQQLFGPCDKLYTAMRKCLKEERLERTRKHLAASRERNEEIREKIAKMQAEGKTWRDAARENAQK